jgi:hypothetical protein
VLLDGNRLLLNCSAQQFGILAEGEVGVLTYQHDVLRSFTRATAVGRD